MLMTYNRLSENFSWIWTVGEAFFGYLDSVVNTVSSGVKRDITQGRVNRGFG